MTPSTPSGSIERTGEDFATSDTPSSPHVCLDPSVRARLVCPYCLPTSELLTHTTEVLECLSDVHDILRHHVTGLRYFEPVLADLEREVTQHYQLLSSAAKERYESMVADYEATNSEVEDLVACIREGRYQRYMQAARFCISVLERRLGEGTPEERRVIKEWLAEWSHGRQSRQERTRKKEMDDIERYRRVGQNEGRGVLEVPLVGKTWWRKTFALTD